MNYVSSGQICSILKITPMTLKRWKDSNLVEFKKITSKKFLYDLDSILHNSSTEIRKNIIYSRVSNSKQKDDLSRQTEIIKSYMLSNGIIPDLIFEEIASGMNENRKEFLKILQLIFQNKINKIYISYKDRLTRFGFEYFKQIFSMFGTEIIILNATKEEDFQEELIQDLISIIHHFSMKMYSHRRTILKEMKKRISE